ncbi:MAG: bacillithiol biosynthesis BshC, partial [Planctomycetota bacterium]
MPGSLPLPYDDREPVYRLRDEKGRAAQELFGAIPGGDEELVALARARSPDPSRREALLDALLPRWDALPLPAASRESLSLLERLETRIVLAGQQPALAGCPLLLFAKALSAARLARRLREAGLAAVPVFWIADEDHDVEELHPGVFPRSGAPPFEIAIPFEEGRTPIADLRLGDGEAPIVAALREALPATAARGWALEALERSAHPSPSEWFQGFLLQALQGEGILPVHPAWLRRMQEPIIRGELSSPGSLAADARAAIPALEALGLAPPIPRPAELPFFMIGEDGGRNRLEPVPGGARMAGGEERRLAHRELEQLLREEPERFSPDALLRPLVQDALLEPLAVILGPTEMAYHLELAGAYPARGIPRPLLMPRLRVRVLDRLLARRLRDRGIDPREAATRDDPA